jgi:hypothetical protein
VRLSVKVAAVVAAAGMLLGPAGATTAWASAPHGRSNATIVCGGLCLDLSSNLLGPAFIQNASGLGGIAGTDRGRKVNLRRGGNARINEDFVFSVDGFVRQFCGTAKDDLFSPISYQCLHYQSLPVFEANFAPDSNESGYCAGVRTARQGAKVRLERCGASARTLWIGDVGNLCGPVTVPDSTTATLPAGIAPSGPATGPRTSSPRTNIPRTNSPLNGDQVIPLTVTDSGLVNADSVVVDDTTLGSDLVLNTDYTVGPGNEVTILAAGSAQGGDQLVITYTDTHQNCPTAQQSDSVPWINGGDTAFSHPLVLTVDNSSKHPVNQLYLSAENTSGGLVPDTQQFSVTAGPSS